MKKTIMCLLAGATILASCEDSKVEAFAREKCHEVGVYDEDIKSIEAEETDSVLGDSWLQFNQVKIAKANYEHITGKLKDKEFKELLEEEQNVISDVSNSLRFGMIMNDSLKKLEKYAHVWRQQYKVTVTLNSGQKKSFNVIMDNQGNPYMTNGEMEKWLYDYGMKLVEMEFSK